MADVMGRLRAANPERDCSPPPIELVWRRLDSQPPKPAGSQPYPPVPVAARRFPSLGGVMLAAGTAAAVGIAVLAIALLEHGRARPAAPPWGRSPGSAHRVPGRHA